MHAAVAFVTLQMCVHVPHDAAVVCVLTSQPSAGLPLQSAKPGLQVAMAHAPVLHAAVAFGRLQACPQVPQFARLVPRFVSQPSEACVLQSA